MSEKTNRLANDKSAIRLESNDSKSSHERLSLFAFAMKGITVYTLGIPINFLSHEEGNRSMNSGSQTVGLYQRMRSEILSLDLIPGERLTERGIENRFGASRTPARAALMRLETEGLVQRDGRGWIVSPIDLNEIAALADFREAVETAVVRLAIEHATDADIDSVAELLEAERPMFNEEESVRAGGDFHIELAQLSVNTFMVDAVRGAMTRLARTRWLEVRTQESREQAWQEHMEIIEMIRRRDMDGGTRLIVSHIRGTNERLLDYLASERRRLRGSGLSIVSTSHAI